MIEMKKRIKSDGKLDNNDHIMHISFLLCYLMMIRDYESILDYLVHDFMVYFMIFFLLHGG